MIFERDPIGRALEERRRDYREAARLASRIFYLRAAREGALAERRAAIARLHDQARTLSRAGERERAQLVEEQIERHRRAIAQEEQLLAESRADARAAIRALGELGEHLDELQRDAARAESVALARELSRAARRPLPRAVERGAARARSRTLEARSELEADRALEPV